MRRHGCDTESDSDGDTLAIVPYHKTEHEFDQAEHARLCFGLGPKYTHKYPDGYQAVHNSRAKPARVYTDAQIERFSSIYRDYFLGLTGFRLDKFKLTRSTYKYVSMLEFARGRDRILVTMFEKRPKIWDLHAGSGGDSFAFLLNCDPREVVMCQRSVSDMVSHGALYDDSLREYGVMCDNIKDFLRATMIDARLDIEGEPDALPAGAQRRHVHVKCKHKLAQNFIMSQTEHSEVDIVYLDPSWDDDHDTGGNSARGREMTPEQLFGQLKRLIWDPIAYRKIKVGCYVIKTRWNWLRVQQYMNEVDSEFIAQYSVRTQPFRPNANQYAPEQYGGVRGVYHYMILTHREYKTIELENSQMYWDIVRNSVPVWVKKSTCVGVIKPMYSSHTQFPDYTERQPSDASGYIQIGSHGKKPRERTTGPHNPGEKTSYDSQKFEPAVQPSTMPDQDYESSDENNGYDTYNRYSVLPPESEPEAQLKTGACASLRPP